MNSFTRIRRNARRTFIEDYAYAPDFVAKLQLELGDRATALRALEGLDAWFIACLHADGRLIGMPSKIVDVAWHEFILRTREYHAFCERAFGFYLHHTPDSTLAVSAASLLPATLDLVDRHDIPMVLFTADADSGWEDGFTYSDVDLRRMRDSHSSPVRRRKRRYASSGSGDGSSYAFAGLFGDSGSGDGGGGSDGGGGGCGGGGCGGGG